MFARLTAMAGGVLGALLLFSACSSTRKVTFDRAYCERQTSCKTMGWCGPKPEPAEGWRQAETRCAPDNEADCRNAKLCKDHGMCSFDAAEKRCTVAGAEDCRAAASCSERGRCGVSSECSGQCAAMSDEDCAASEACRKYGHCRREGCNCVADESRCQQSEQCRTRGRCVTDGKNCVVGEQTDCAATEGCRKYGYCKAVRYASSWRCAVTTTDDCLRAEACAEWGMCSAILDREPYAICTAASDEDCARARRCKTHGRCKAFSGSCHLPVE